MAFYENVFIARQDISSAQVDNLLENFKAVISEGGGSVEKTEYWGLRSLAYRMKKNRKGHYVMMNIDAPAAAVQEMERQMRLNEDIIRLLTVRVEELEEGPSIMMQSRSRDRDRDGRGHRGGPRHRHSEEGSRSRAAEEPSAPAQAEGAAQEKAAQEKAAEEKEAN